MKLHYKTHGSGPALVILHGLFGSADNWRGLAKQLSKHAEVITVDLRNHGRSPHSPDQTYSLMADDLAELIEELGLSTIDLIGHSVGGKVAMAFGQAYPELVRKLVIVDIAPRRYADEHSVLFKSLLAVDLAQYSTRNDVDKALQSTVPNKAVRQFLLMNLAMTGKDITWRINLQALCDCYPHLLDSVCDGAVIPHPVCFIRGDRSEYINQSDVEQIRTQFPLAQIVTIENAGHWVHADAPQAFLVKVLEFFDYD